jgi:hypothetical protein
MIRKVRLTYPPFTAIQALDAIGVGEMTGVQNLALLLATMEPVLWDEPYGYALLPLDQEPPEDAFALVREDEGMTVIAPLERLKAHGIDVDGAWARISLTVASSLAAVGLTAALARALADEGISANVVAGFCHDHVFVPWDRRNEAVAALHRLSANAA